MIRKLSLIIVAVLFMAGTAFAQTPGFRADPGIGDILGQSKLQSDAHKIFRMVRYVPVTYAGSTALAADSIVVWDVTNDDGVTVTTTTLSSDSTVAGIIVQQALTPESGNENNTAAQDRGERNWTWLQTFGLSQVDLVATVSDSVAGEAMGTSTTAGEATVHQYAGPAALDPLSQGMAGFFVDAATAGANDVEVFLRGLD